MSKNRNINLPGDYGDSSPDVESLLKRAAPEDVSLDRDALMFQAGLRATLQSRPHRVVWPVIAALLLVACGGISFALVHEIHRSRDLESLLANLERAPNNAELAAQSNGDPATGAITAAESPRETIGESIQTPRLRNLRFLISAAHIPSGQLTAAGWERGSNETPAEPVHSSPSNDANAPRRPPTYLELLRSYQEG